MTSHAERYFKAMVRGDVDTCIAIEQATSLFGYPPELVSIGLRAMDEGRDAATAIAEYIDGVDDENLSTFAAPKEQP